MHNKTQLDLQEMIEKFPALQKLPELQVMVDRMPADHELAAMTAQFEADMAAVLMEEIIFDFSDIDAAGSDTAKIVHPVPAPSATKSQRTTIRIPGAVLAGFKAQALATGTRYQTLMIRTLRTASASW